jgi:signal transduction histidine kinase
MLDRITSSIGGKLLLLVVAVAVFALSLSGVSLVIYEARTYHERWVQDLDAQANILGLSSGAALAFNDEAAARQNLELLRTRPAILAAAIYDERGALFARFARDGGDEHVPDRIDAAADRVEVRGDRVLITKRIVEGSSYRGAVFMRATYGLAERVRNYAGILAAVMLASLAAAVAFATLLQKRITRPIVAVAETAHRVIDTRDFSLRVDKSTTDEIGDLVDAFNGMLSEIGARAQAIAAADRMKDQFLATLAHELRNPLAPISNALHILKMAKSRPELADPARAMMERQVKQLVRLVDDLLDISRITTGKLTLRVRPVRLRTILENALEIARPLVDERHQTLVVDLDSADVELDVDETRLAQVFSNLLNNASKYTQEGGRIELRARLERDSVEVDVVDNGIGMSPEHVHDMFSMFAQADTRIERASQSGLGVGLALAKTLVQMHDGTIQGHSEGEGRGSRFTVCLPLARGEPQHVTGPAAFGEPPGGV